MFRVAIRWLKSAWSPARSRSRWPLLLWRNAFYAEKLGEQIFFELLLLVRYSPNALSWIAVLQARDAHATSRHMLAFGATYQVYYRLYQRVYCNFSLQQMYCISGTINHVSRLAPSCGRRHLLLQLILCYNTLLIRQHITWLLWSQMT